MKNNTRRHGKISGYAWWALITAGDEVSVAVSGLGAAGLALYELESKAVTGSAGLTLDRPAPGSRPSRGAFWSSSACTWRSHSPEMPMVQTMSSVSLATPIGVWTEPVNA